MLFSFIIFIAINLFIMIFFREKTVYKILSLLTLDSSCTYHNIKFLLINIFSDVIMNCFDRNEQILKDGNARFGTVV